MIMRILFWEETDHLKGISEKVYIENMKNNEK